MSTVGQRLSENVATLNAQLGSMMALLEELRQIVNGTAKSGGLKERIAVAEEEIKRNKASFEKIDANITALRNEMLIEVGRIAATANAASQQKASFWRKLGETAAVVALSTITAGVVGVTFWQIIIWLAANAPVP